MRWLWLSSLYFIWLGMVLAISFMEAPVKFLAPSLTRAVALDVGRTVFTAFHILQAVMALAVLLLSLSLIKYFPWLWLAVLALLLIILALQSFWLLPALTQRALAIGAGEVLAPSTHHIIYSVLEGAKTLLLLCLAIFCLRQGSL